MTSINRLSDFSAACRANNEYDAASSLSYILSQMDKTYSGSTKLWDIQQTELRLACASGNLNTVNYLLSIGTLSMSTTTGEDLLLSSLRFGRNHLDVAKRLIEWGVKATHSDFTFILEDAAADGNLDLVKLLAENGVASDYVNAFTIALDRKHHAIVKYFIARSLSHGLGLDALPKFIEYNAEHPVNPNQWPPLDWDREWDTDETTAVFENTFYNKII
jgi:hypothetical protein